VAVASIVNVVGDLALSPKWGIQGAAAATALATVASCIILVAKVRRTTSQWKIKQEMAEAIVETYAESENTGMEQPLLSSSEGVGTSAGAVNKVETDITRRGATKEIPFWSLPDKAATIDLFKLAGPIFFVMMGKIACYSILTIRASNFGITPLAAHNIMMRVFFFFACFGDSLSQATQSFYPQVAKNLRGKLLQRLAVIAAVVGVCNHQVSQLILRQFGRFLTKDASIIQMMSEYSPFVGAAILLHPFLVLFEGTVLAKRDFVFMIGMYILTGLFHFGFVFSPVSATFKGLWRALFVYQIVRLVQFALRVWDTARREKIPAAPVPAELRMSPPSLL
jgi:Na+-driven multidrug efflux pump